MIGTMGATLQFAAVPPAFDALQVGAPERAEIRIGTSRQLQTEPLPSHCLAILETGIAHVTDLETRQPGKRLGDLLGIQVALLDQQP